MILTIVGIYCGRIIINQSEPYFRITTSSLEQTRTFKNPASQLPNQVLWVTERELNTQNSSSVHNIQVETHMVEKIQPTTVSQDAVSNASEVTGLPTKESQHATSMRQSDESKGYVLPFFVNEEQTNGAKNLWQLQIWANLVKMRVVEPFVQDSIFTMNGIAPDFNKALRFGDYFDLEEWNTMVVGTHGSPLVKWEEFIAKSPRDAILLYMAKGKFTKPLTIAYDNDIDQYVQYCRTAITESDMKWIHANFNITKRVCYLSAGNIPHALTFKSFNSIIFGDLRPNKVSLIVTGWEGIRNSRINITPINIFMAVFRENIIFSPSKRVLKAYKSYVTRYVGNKTYVGIVFRSHHILYYNQYFRKHNFTGMSQTLLQCSKQLKVELDKIRSWHEIFLAIDLGTFGSKKYSTGDKLTPLKNQIHLDIFNGSLTPDQREERLKNAAGGITDCGFIAQLEKVIATNADCIILLGRKSGFVSTSLTLYLTRHPVDRCVVSICYNDVYNPDHTLLSSRHIPEKFI